jgi:PTH1 family peptidyl-tRNA hydrolase
VSDYVIVGLGNPGSEHASDRHNVGFRVVNLLAKRHGIDLRNSKLASAGRGVIEGAEVTLVKPRTWYNGSGKAAAYFLKADHVEVDHLIVVHDELDLPVGRIRLRPKGSTAGNNGLKSVMAEVGSSEFGRLRVGIGRPRDRGVPSWDPEVVMRHVLGQPSRDDRQTLEAAIERAAEAIAAVIRDGWLQAMGTYNADSTEQQATDN